MKQQLILIALALVISLTFISASNNFGYNYLDTSGSSFNNNTANVNNSQYLQGLTPQQVADLFTETDPFYFSNPSNYYNVSTLPVTNLSGYVPYTGATSNVDLNGKNIINVTRITINNSYIDAIGDLYLQNGGSASHPNIILNASGTASPVLFDLYSQGIEAVYMQYLRGSENQLKLFNNGNLNLFAGSASRIFVNGTTGLITLKNNVNLDNNNLTNIFYINNLSFINMYNINPTSYGVPTGVALFGSPNVTTGSHQWYVTFIVNGKETVYNQNALTLQVNASNQIINITYLPTGPPGTTARKIYRTKALYTSDARQYLLATVNDNTTTSYIDGIPDASLGAQAYSKIWDGTGGVIDLNGKNVFTAIEGITVAGYDAGKYASTPANLVAIGTRAGYNSSGLENTFVGYQAGYKATSASFTVALGTSALSSLTTGFHNFGLGRAALGSVQGGGYNTAVGSGSLQSITSGINNVGIGYLAGGSLTTGAQTNTFVGWQSGGITGQATGAINTIGIGGNVFTTRNNQAVIGTSDRIFETQLFGRVGINISNTTTLNVPSAMLDVHGEGALNGSLVQFSNSSGDAKFTMTDKGDIYVLGNQTNGLMAISGTYQILKDVDLIGLTKTYCNQTFTNGWLTSTTC